MLLLIMNSTKKKMNRTKRKNTIKKYISLGGEQANNQVVNNEQLPPPSPPPPSPPDLVDDMNQHFKEITPDGLKNANTEMIGEQVSEFGNSITELASQNINNYIIKFNDIVEKYIKPLDIKLLGSSLHIVMLKSNILLKEIRPELEVVFKELIELSANLVDDTNPIFKKLISSFIDNITSVFTVFITKMFGIMSMVIQDIIKAIPVVGEVFDIIQLFSRSSLCFFQILSQILCTYRDLVEIIGQITAGTKENIENWRRIKNALLNILFKIGNIFRNIIPDMGEHAQNFVSNVSNLNENAQKIVSNVSNMEQPQKIMDNVSNMTKHPQKIMDNMSKLTK